MKYRNTKTADGFASKFERAVFYKLKEREILGQIEDIKMQQLVVLQGGKREKRITWRVDFSFLDIATQKTIYCEAKGFETAVYKLKLKLWREKLPYDLEIWKGDYKRPRVHEYISSGEPLTRFAEGSRFALSNKL